MAISATFNYTNDTLAITSDGNGNEVNIRVYNPNTTPQIFEKSITDSGNQNVTVKLPSGYWAIAVEQLTSTGDVMASDRIPNSGQTKRGTPPSLPSSLTEDDGQGNIEIAVSYSYLWSIDEDYTTVDNLDSNYSVSGQTISAEVDPGSSFDVNVRLTAKVTISSSSTTFTQDLSESYTASKAAFAWASNSPSKSVTSVTCSVVNGSGSYTYIARKGTGTDAPYIQIDKTTSSYSFNNMPGGEWYFNVYDSGLNKYAGTSSKIDVPLPKISTTMTNLSSSGVTLTISSWGNYSDCAIQGVNANVENNTIILTGLKANTLYDNLQATFSVTYKSVSFTQTIQVPQFTTLPAYIYKYYKRYAIQSQQNSSTPATAYSVLANATDINLTNTEESINVNPLSSTYYHYQGYKKSNSEYPNLAYDQGIGANDDKTITLSSSQPTYITVYHKKIFNYQYRIRRTDTNNNVYGAKSGSSTYQEIDLSSLENYINAEKIGYTYNGYSLGNNTSVSKNKTVSLTHTTTSIDSKSDQYITVWVKPAYSLKVTCYYRDTYNGSYQKGSNKEINVLNGTEGVNVNVFDLGDQYEYVGYSASSEINKWEIPEETYVFQSTGTIELNVYYDKITYPYIYTRYNNGEKVIDGVEGTAAGNSYGLGVSANNYQLYKCEINGVDASDIPETGNLNIPLTKNKLTTIIAYFSTIPSISTKSGADGKSDWEIEFNGGYSGSYTLYLKTSYSGTAREEFNIKISNQQTYTIPLIPYGYTCTVFAVDGNGLKTNSLSVTGQLKPGGILNVADSIIGKCSYQILSFASFYKAKVQYELDDSGIWVTKKTYTESMSKSAEIDLTDIREEKDISHKYKFRIAFTTETDDEDAFWGYSKGNYYSYISTEAGPYTIPPKNWSIHVYREMNQFNWITFRYIDVDGTTEREYIYNKNDPNSSFIVPHGTVLTLGAVKALGGYRDLEIESQPASGITEVGHSVVVKQSYNFRFQYNTYLENYPFIITFDYPIALVKLSNWYEPGEEIAKNNIFITPESEYYGTTLKADQEKFSIDLEIFYESNANQSLYDFNSLKPSFGLTIIGKNKASYSLDRVPDGKLDLSLSYYSIRLGRDENTINNVSYIDGQGKSFILDEPHTIYRYSGASDTLTFTGWTYLPGHKNIHIYEAKSPNNKVYLSKNSTYTIPSGGWGVGKTYIVSADPIQQATLCCDTTKYTLTINLSNIDEIFYGSQNTITIYDKEVGINNISTNLTINDSTASFTFGNGQHDQHLEAYKFKAGQTYNVTITLIDKNGQSENNQTIISGSIVTKTRDNPKDIVLTAGGKWIQVDIEGNYSDYYRADVKCNNNLQSSLNNVTAISEKRIENLTLNTSYTITVVLYAIDGSGDTWTKTKSINTLSAYSVSFNLNGVSKIKAKSDIEPNGIEISNGETLSVSPDGQMEFMNAITYATIAPGTERLRNYTYTAPVTFIKQTSEGSSSGTLYNRDKSFNSSTHTINGDNITFTIKATPADWEWPSGYTKDTTQTGIPILTKGGKVSLFEYEAWNELMFYLNKWSQYLNKLYTNYENTLMTSTNKTLTAAIYNHAYAQLNTLFTNLSDAIITNAVSRETQLTAKGLEDFGNTINYNNIKE